jgi:stalled ribosome alternative rescue factor ArfA
VRKPHFRAQTVAIAIVIIVSALLLSQQLRISAEATRDRNAQIVRAAAIQRDSCSRENALRAVLRDVLARSQAALEREGTLSAARKLYYRQSIAALADVSCGPDR